MRPGAAGEAEGATEVAELGGAEDAADQVLAVIGDEAAHTHALVGEPVPDREQQAGDQPEAGVAVARQTRDLGIPECAPLCIIGNAPLRGVQRRPCHGLA